MPTISELSENKDEILTIDLEEIETEELLLGKNIKKGFFISSVINEIINEAKIPKDVAELIALYGVDASLEDWVSLTSWLPQRYKSRMILTRLCLLLTVFELFQMVLDQYNLSHVKYPPALFWTRLVLVPGLSEINFFLFLVSFITLYSKEMTIKEGKRCCIESWPNHLDNMKNLSKLPLEQINEKKIEDFLHHAKWYLSDCILDAPYFTSLFVLPLISGLSSFVISFFSSSPPENGIEITVKTTAAIGITLASFGLYKNCQIKNRMLRDKRILTAESPDYSQLTL